MQRESSKTRVVQIVTVALLVLVIVGGLVMAGPSYRRSRSLRAQVAELDAEIEAKKAEIAALKDQQRRFKTDRDFVEGIARQDRRVYPGELVFVFDDKGRKK